ARPDLRSRAASHRRADQRRDRPAPRLPAGRRADRTGAGPPRLARPVLPRAVGGVVPAGLLARRARRPARQLDPGGGRRGAVERPRGVVGGLRHDAARAPPAPAGPRPRPPPPARPRRRAVGAPLRALQPGEPDRHARAAHRPRAARDDAVRRPALLLQLPPRAPRAARRRAPGGPRAVGAVAPGRGAARAADHVRRRHPRLRRALGQLRRRAALPRLARGLHAAPRPGHARDAGPDRDVRAAGGSGRGDGPGGRRVHLRAAAVPAGGARRSLVARAL
ncbi:MAG: hypothetical protein AVDCRST_MAG30-1565, partial [uncultured Solirubrobacteraceae bacterium]